MKIAILNANDLFSPDPSEHQIRKPNPDQHSDLEQLIEEINDGHFDKVFIWHASTQALELIGKISRVFRSSVILFGRLEWTREKMIPYMTLGCRKFVDARFGVWQGFDELLKPPVPTPTHVPSSDAPYCMQCGVQMQRAGSCHACPSCGSTSGCS